MPENNLISKKNASKAQSVSFIVEKFSLKKSVNHLHEMMEEVTKKEFTPETVKASCECVGKINEIIDTAINAARFIREEEN